MNSELSLQVQEAYVLNFGKAFLDVLESITRIHKNIMSRLNLLENDFIEIKGNHKTVAKCMPLHHEEKSNDIIRIDRITRNNAKVHIGDTVSIKKIEPAPAKKIIIKPIRRLPTDIKTEVETSIINRLKETNRSFFTNDFFMMGHYKVHGLAVKCQIVHSEPKNQPLTLNEETAVEFEENVVGSIPRYTSIAEGYPLSYLKFCRVTRLEEVIHYSDMYRK